MPMLVQHQKHGNAGSLQRREHKYPILPESIDPVVSYAAESAGWELTLKTITQLSGNKAEGTVFGAGRAD